MIIKGVLFFLIIVTIVYVFIDQKSQNELIDSLQNEISTLKKSIDIRIKQELNKVITQGDALFLRKPKYFNNINEQRKLVFAALVFGQIEYAASCSKDLNILY